MFKVGDIAVYPAHGVVKVKGIEVKEICGTKKQFFILKVIDNDVTVLVPTDNARAIGLRSVVCQDDILKIYHLLKTKKDCSNNGHQSWNKRYREYADRLKSGNIFDVAAVLKDIFLLQNEKDLSFGERRIMDSARSLLIREISISKSAQEELIAEEIDNLLTE